MKKIIITSAVFFMIILSSMYGCKKSAAPGPAPTATPDLNLAGAVDCFDAPWYSQASTGSRWSRQVTDTHDGVDAAKSGAVPDVDAVSYISAIAPGPGDVSFWWKVQALAGDGDFYVNTVNVLHTQDTTGWVNLTGIYLPNAVNTLKWQYKKTTTTAETGAGVVLDEVYLVKYSPTVTFTITPTATITITALTMRFRDGQYPDASYAGTRDTYIDNNNPNVNNGSCQELQVKYSSTFQNCKALLDFDTAPGITPNTAIVAGAKLSITLKQAVDIIAFNILHVPSVWSEGTQCGITATSGATWYASDYGVTTWATPGVYIYGGAGYNDDNSFGTTTTVEFILNAGRSSIQRMVDKTPTTYMDYGFRFELSTFYNPAPYYRDFVFYSRETPTVESRPMLEIYYYLK